MVFWALIFLKTTASSHEPDVDEQRGTHHRLSIFTQLQKKKKKKERERGIKSVKRKER